MKTNPQILRRLLAAFTLIELLVVIAIIGILAALLFPALGKVKEKALIGQTRTDMNNLALAIKSYESDYNGRLPAPGIPTGLQDVTYGYVANPPLANPGHYALANNRDVIAVLLNLEKFSDGTVTTNAGKVFNPRGLTPWNPRIAKDNTSAGVGPDGEFRDPWGNSIVISLDTSLNERTRDVLYARQSVSQEANGNPRGYFGLSNTNGNGDSDHYEFAGQYLIWSRGPDGQADPQTKARVGVNKDNILSWQ